MTAYRIVTKLSHPILGEKEYISPRIFLFTPFGCDMAYQEEFVARCRFLFIKNYEQYAEDETLSMEMTYKEYEIYPFRDLWKRFITLIKYWI